MYRMDPWPTRRNGHLVLTSQRVEKNSVGESTGTQLEHAQDCHRSEGERATRILTHYPRAGRVITQLALTISPLGLLETQRPSSK